jgi:hypothetical protein
MAGLTIPDRTFAQRWTVSFFACGILSLTLANLAGRDASSSSWDMWVHGWPFGLCYRIGLYHPPTVPPGWHGALNCQWPPDTKHQKYRNGKPTQPAPTSWWDFYRGDRRWRIQPVGWIIVVGVWAVLLLAAGIACAQSRYVRMGKPQVSLQTILVAMGAAGFLLIGGGRQWPQLFAVPVITAAFVGAIACIKWLTNSKRRANGRNAII